MFNILFSAQYFVSALFFSILCLTEEAEHMTLTNSLSLSLYEGLKVINGDLWMATENYM